MTLPEGAKPVKGKCVLALGEATGHCHVVEPLVKSAKYLYTDHNKTVSSDMEHRTRMVSGAELAELFGVKLDLAGGRRPAPVIYEHNGEMFFLVKSPSVVTHQEHGAIALAPGVYKSTIQHEYVPNAPARRVID
jgi:hypothetical protein